MNNRSTTQNINSFFTQLNMQKKISVTIKFETIFYFDFIALFFVKKKSININFFSL